jgi:hypothetical protein
MFDFTKVYIIYLMLNLLYGFLVSIETMKLEQNVMYDIGYFKPIRTKRVPSEFNVDFLILNLIIFR